MSKAFDGGELEKKEAKDLFDIFFFYGNYN